jgi:hypothetical protein
MDYSVYSETCHRDGSKTDVVSNYVPTKDTATMDGCFSEDSTGPTARVKHNIVPAGITEPYHGCGHWWLNRSRHSDRGIRANPQRTPPESHTDRSRLMLNEDTNIYMRTAIVLDEGNGATALEALLHRSSDFFC